MLVRIMGCKEREDNINKLIPDLGDNVEVIWDKKRNVIDTLVRALDTDEDVIILEDDVELCDGFLHRAMEEIGKHPDCFIQFYSANADEIIPHKDEEFKGFRVWTQAYYIPGGRGIARGMADYVQRDEEYTPQGRYSNPMYQYLEKEGVKIHIVKQSLCQHLWFGNSLIPNHEHCNHSSRKYKKSFI